MVLSELEKLIGSALKDCETIITNDPYVVLSEADLEKLVSWCIQNRLNQGQYQNPSPKDFTVHTQISHYLEGHNRPNRRVDILLLTEEGIKKWPNNKGFKYIDDSFAIELKYYHAKESIDDIRCDFCKRRELEKNSWLYVVALIDSNEEFSNKKEAIYAMKDELIEKYPEYENTLFCYVMMKPVE